MDSPDEISVELGHVHLKVSDLEESLAFYRDIFGLDVTEEHGSYVFLSGGPRHHDIALQEVHGSKPGKQGPGLYHVAFEVPDREALTSVKHRAESHVHTIHPVDHGISESLYFSDPSGNGIEVYHDTRTQKNVTKWKGTNKTLSL